mgnify:FL=1
MGASSVHYFENAQEAPGPLSSFLECLSISAAPCAFLRMSKILGKGLMFLWECPFLYLFKDVKESRKLLMSFWSMPNNLGDPWCLFFRNVKNHEGPKWLSLRMPKNLRHRRLVFLWRFPRISGSPCAFFKDLRESWGLLASFLRIRKNLMAPCTVFKNAKGSRRSPVLLWECPGISGATCVFFENAQESRGPLVFF